MIFDLFLNDISYQPLSVRKTKTFLVVLLMGLLNFQACLAAPVQQEEKVYKSNVAVGPFQKVGTLSPISLKVNEQAQEAVILVPGLNSMKLTTDLYEWKNFWNIWQDYKLPAEAKAKYRFFVFRYDGWDSLYTSAEALTRGITQLMAEEPNLKKITFIGYSQGGLLPRIIFTKNPEIEPLTRKVISMAVPHQGAIVLTKKLSIDSINLQPPLVREKNLFALNVIAGRYSYAYLEQAWKDFDHGIPPSAKYTPPQEALEFPDLEDKSKYITYASYIYPPSLSDFEDKFSSIFSEQIPRMFWDRRAGMKELNRWMGKKVYKDEKPSLRDHLRMNDGVTPLASGLWAHMCTVNEEQPANWKALFPTNNFCPSTPMQRAFYSIDHLAWREASSGRKQVKDLLHPELGNKRLYDWLIEDLLAD